MKKKILIIVGICLVITIFLCILFFLGNKTEKMCIKECESTGAVFIKYEISNTYEFIQCICSLEGDSKTLYFDLNTKEGLTNQEILNRILS